MTFSSTKKRVVIHSQIENYYVEVDLPALLEKLVMWVAIIILHNYKQSLKPLKVAITKKRFGILLKQSALT